MKKERVIVIFLGVWLVILSFLGLPSSVQKVFMLITGVVIVFISMWRGASENVEKSIQEASPENKEIS